MYLKVTKQKNGRVNLSLVHGYRDPETKKVRQRVIENLGYLDEYEHLYDDPVAHFREVAKQRTLELKRENEKKEIHLGSISTDELMEANESALKHLGFMPLSKIYHELKINQFLINRQRNLSIKYSLNDVMQLLIYARILCPGSKRANFAEKENFATSFNCDLHDGYRALSLFAKLKEDLLVHLHEQVRINYKRKANVVFYDVTNYYFQIDKDDNFRKKGFCKNNTRKPLVQMGLLLDENAIPITYRLFEGNTHDSQTMMPLLQKVRQEYGLGRIITVADKALNSGDNVAFLMSKKDGFIFSQKIRGASQELQDFVFDGSDYQNVRGIIKSIDDAALEEDPPVFKLKSRIHPQQFLITHGDDVKRKIPIDVKQIVCYNEQYAKRQKHKREEVIEKAYKIIANPSRYKKNEASGALRYVKNIEIDSKTGVCVKTKNIPFLNEAQVVEVEKYDGYYSIITSEINMPDSEVVKAYHGLWEIERSFRITKTDLETRPVNVSLKDHIEAHFLTCFIALLILRLLDKKLAGKHSPEKIIKSLRKYQACFVKDNVFRLTHYDEVVDDLGKILKLPLNSRFMTKGDISQLVADSKKK